MDRLIININYSPGRYGSFVVEITIHTYGGPGRSLYNWFNNPQSFVSAHYAAFMDGNSEQYVEEWDTAWHAGVWDVNTRSIGIEHQDNGNPYDSFRTPELYAASARLCADICRRNSFPATSGTIRPHNAHVAKVCPGGLSVDRIVIEANLILNPPPPLDDLYRIIKNGSQINAFKEFDNALDCFYENKADRVTFKGADITNSFIDTMNKLQTQISSLEAQINKASKENLDILNQKSELQIKNSELITKLEKLNLEKGKLVNPESLTTGELIALLLFNILKVFGKKPSNA